MTAATTHAMMMIELPGLEPAVLGLFCCDHDRNLYRRRAWHMHVHTSRVGRGVS
jgi:hypothetical protein